MEIKLLLFLTLNINDLSHCLFLKVNVALNYVMIGFLVTRINEIPALMRLIVCSAGCNYTII
jgi:hypothetical protein